MNTQESEAYRLARGLSPAGTHSLAYCKEAAAELRRLHQSETEGWRYAAELEQERKRLHEVNQELLEALQRIKHHFDTDEYAWKIAEAAIAKAGEQP